MRRRRHQGFLLWSLHLLALVYHPARRRLGRRRPRGHRLGDGLEERSRTFHRRFFSTTLPSYVFDAVSANLAIFKSPTVLKQEDGMLWCWEGCAFGNGCCHGSCIHVCKYAQAIPHLFPALERTLRDRELKRSVGWDHEAVPRLADQRGAGLAEGAVPPGRPQPGVLHPHLGSGGERRPLRAAPRQLRIEF
ncbi:MAG: hypothetical protein FJY95_07725 [Candidatus Handelsmanbacteria bacterium]|nr:hypothetical protein [Candidatus Handelsmanbacteria bacterium]